jgi:hypothetical protein
VVTLVPLDWLAVKLPATNTIERAMIKAEENTPNLRS